MAPSRLLNDATEDAARQMLRTCCESSAWIDRMLRRRPFRDDPDLIAAAREEWFALAPSDWREAFSQHPRIGDIDALRRRFAATRHLSEKEQHGVADATGDLLAALAQGNQLYEDKFGYIFIVCATGKTASEMLALLRQRLANDASTEIRVAAAEQAKITEIRLAGLN